MLINNNDFLKKVLLFAAEELYKIQFDFDALMPHLEDSIKDKSNWISDTIEQWFEQVQEKYPKEFGNTAICDVNDVPELTKITENKSKNLSSKFYKLKIGECFDLDNFTKITKVMDGWIYDGVHGVAFIPKPYGAPDDVDEEGLNQDV